MARSVLPVVSRAVSQTHPICININCCDNSLQQSPVESQPDSAGDMLTYPIAPCIRSKSPSRPDLDMPWKSLTAVQEQTKPQTPEQEQEQTPEQDQEPPPSLCPGRIREPPLFQMSQRCPMCTQWILYEDEIATYNGDLDDYQGWMCHKNCVTFD